MEETRDRKWPVILFFTVIGIVFAVSVRYLVIFVQDAPQTASLSQVSPAGENVVSIAGDRVLLVSGKEAVFKSSRIVYRGIEDQELCFDLFILQLDPHYSYPHRIPVNEARDGFRLGDQEFELLAAGKSEVRLKLIN